MTESEEGVVVPCIILASIGDTMLRPIKSSAVLFLTWTVLVVHGQDGPVRDEEFKLLHFVPLDYPLAARVKQVQGVVTVRVDLGDDGGVTSAKAISGPDALIADSVSNARKWRFQPNASKRAIIIYDYRIEGLCLAPCASQFLLRPPNIATIRIGETVFQPY